MNPLFNESFWVREVRLRIGLTAGESVLRKVEGALDMAGLPRELIFDLWLLAQQDIQMLLDSFEALVAEMVERRCKHQKPATFPPADEVHPLVGPASMFVETGTLEQRYAVGLGATERTAVRVRNQTGHPITGVFVHIKDEATFRGAGEAFLGSSASGPLGSEHRFIRLPEPMLPGDELPLELFCGAVPAGSQRLEIEIAPAIAVWTARRCALLAQVRVDAAEGRAIASLLSPPAQDFAFGLELCREVRSLKGRLSGGVELDSVALLNGDPMPLGHAILGTDGRSFEIGELGDAHGSLILACRIAGPAEPHRFELHIE